MACIVSGNELRLTGDVGDFGWADHFTAGDVLLALAAVDDASDLTVHLNSGGGYATEGAAIHALLSRRSGSTNIVIDGIAASAASLIAMAGDTVSMSAGAVMMIHDPASWTMGDAAAHQKSIEGLEALATAYARVYADKSGKTVEECRQVMIDETWFTPEQAVEAGFADEAIADKARPVAAFDYRAYAHAPQRLRALASRKSWGRTTPEPHKESTMPTPPNGGAADAHASATARIKAIMQAPEAEGRNKLAEHLAFDTAMDADAAIAVMKVAPGGEQNDLNDSQQRRIVAAMREDAQLNGQGLRGGFGSPRSDSGIVAAMRQRHAVK